jgi:hypothetical protein
MMMIFIYSPGIDFLREGWLEANTNTASLVDFQSQNMGESLLMLIF